MDLYLEDVLDGINGVLKQANTALFSTPSSVSLFPVNSNQAKWKYSKGEKFLKLHDGNVVHHFELPQGESSDQSFPLTRLDDSSFHEFESGSTHTGLAQVHRSDPGSIYVTLQDGRNNPTYTIRHLEERKWQAIPKARKKKEPVVYNVEPSTIVESVKEGIFKQADVMNWTAGTALPALETAVRAPGRNPLLSGLVGGGAGLGYHLLKQKFYNTDEENAQEAEDPTLALKRVALPALAGGVGGYLQDWVTPDYYKDVAANPASTKFKLLK